MITSKAWLKLAARKKIQAKTTSWKVPMAGNTSDPVNRPTLLWAAPAPPGRSVNARWRTGRGRAASPQATKVQAAPCQRPPRTIVSMRLR